MAKYKPHISRFDIGEWDVDALARTDIEGSNLASEIQENILPYRVGKGLVRPGTTWLGKTDGRIIKEFVRSPTEKALLEIGPGLLRVWIDDAVVTRPAVTATVANGDFTAATDWDENPTQSGANSTVGFAGELLRLGPNYQGTTSWRQQAVVCNEPGVEHALEIWVALGVCQFQVGSFPGGDDLVAKTNIRKGRHSLAFTPLGTFYIRFTQQTPDRITEINECQIAAEGPMVVLAPWITDSDLDYFQFDQSADTIFVANRAFPPSMIERRGDTSWSVTYYEPEDGPFNDEDVPGQGQIGIKVDNDTDSNLGETEGGEVLISAMDGTLFRTYHPQMDKTARLAGDNEYTDVFNVQGIRGVDNNDRKFTYDVNMTGSGTITFERSVSGENGDFNPTPRARGTSTSTTTGSISATHTGNDEDNNLNAFHRIGFADGGHGGSGNSATVRVTYQGDSGYGVARFITVTPGGGASGDSFASERYTRAHGSDIVTKDWELGAWSNYYEWPSGVALFDNRLWWGGQSEIWGSAFNAFFSFDDLNSADIAMIRRRLSAGGQTSQTNFLLPLQNMIIGTSGSELSIKASAIGEILTPTNVSLKSMGSFGSKPVEPVRIDQDGLFIHRDGVTSLLLRYSGGVEDYSIEKLTELAGHILGTGCRALGVQRQPETYVWHVREDGQVAVLNMEHTAEDISSYGWSRYVSQGLVEDVAVLPEDDEDSVYFITGYSPPEDGTNAERRAFGRTNFISVDFLDMSYSTTLGGKGSVSSLSYADVIDEWGRAQGPDAIFNTANRMTVSNTINVDELGGAFRVERVYNAGVMTKKDNGWLSRPFSNSLALSEDLAGPTWPAEASGEEHVNVRRFTACSASTDVTTAPNGTMTADKLVVDGSTGEHWMSLGYFQRNTTSVGRSDAEVFSVFLKADEYTECTVSIFAYGDSDAYATDPFSVGQGFFLHTVLDYDINLAAGTIDSLTETRDPGIVYSLVPDGHWAYRDPSWPTGWYRYFFYFWDHVTSGGRSGFCLRMKDGDGNLSFMGDGTSGFNAWGWQHNKSGMYRPIDSATGLPQQNWPYVYNDTIYPKAFLPYDYDDSGTLIGLYSYPYDTQYQKEANMLGDFAADGGRNLTHQHSRWGQFATFFNTYQAGLDGESTDNPLYRYATQWSQCEPYIDRSTICPDGTTGSCFDIQLVGDTYQNVNPDNFNYYGMLNNEINTDSFFGHMYLQLMVRPEDSSGNLIQLLWYDEEFGPLMEIYSVTFEIQNNDPLNPAPTLHQEFYQEGSGTDHFTDRRYGVETLPNGWYRLWASCYYGYDYGASSKASFRMGIIFPEAGFGFPAVTQVPYNTYNETAADVRDAPPLLGLMNFKMLGVEGRSNRSGTFDERPPYPELDTWTAGAGVNSGLAHNIDVRDHLNWTSPTNDMTMEQEFTVRSTVDADWIEEDTLYYTDHFLYANLYAGPEDQRDISDSNTVLPTPGYVQHGPGITRADQLNFNANKFQDNQALYSPGGDTISEGDVVNVTWQVEDGRALMYRSGTLISDVAWTSPIDSGVGDNSGDIVQIQFEDMTRPGSQGFGLPRFPNQEAHYHHLLFVGDEGDNDYDASQTAGSAVRVLEKLNRHSEAKGAAITKTADAGLFFAGPVSSVTMLHLQGYDLVAWGTRVSDGAVGPITGLQADSTTGVVELGDSYTNVFIGAPYSARYKSGRLAYGGQGGTSMEQPKRVSGLGVLLQDTHRNAVRFGSDFSNLRSMPIVSKGLIQPANQIYADYDDVMFTFPGLWDTDSRVVIQVDAPYPATFTGLVYGVETETRGGRNTKGRSRSNVKRRGRGR